jgi:hypothetical protein
MRRRDFLKLTSSSLLLPSFLHEQEKNPCKEITIIHNKVIFWTNNLRTTVQACIQTYDIKHHRVFVKYFVLGNVRMDFIPGPVLSSPLFHRVYATVWRAHNRIYSSSAYENLTWKRDSVHMEFLFRSDLFLQSEIHVEGPEYGTQGSIKSGSMFAAPSPKKTS